MRSTRWFVGGIAIALVLAVTLTPSGNTPETLSACLICGERGTADALANVVLFVVLGAAVFLAIGRGYRALLLAVALSATVELLQLVIPGRDASPADLLFDTLGALLGVGIARAWPIWTFPSARAARRLAIAAGGVALLAALLPGYLAAPSFPRSRYYGQWTVLHGGMEHYEGRVSATRVGPVAIPDTEVVGSARVRLLLEQGAPIHVDGTAGPPPKGLAPIFTVYDGQTREILLIGADHEDLVFRYANRAARVRMDPPQLRFAGALRDVAPGDPMELAVWSKGSGVYCIRAGARERCGLHFTAGDAWMLLVGPANLPAPLLVLLRVAWFALLLLPLGFWVRGGRGAALAAALLVLALALGPTLTGAPGTAPEEYLGALLGLGIGLLARHLVDARWGPAGMRGSASHVAGAQRARSPARASFPGPRR